MRDKGAEHFARRLKCQASLCREATAIHVYVLDPSPLVRGTCVGEPELHIQPSQQKRLVNRLNALCDQTIVTTHSPIVAAMFPAPDTLFVETREGVLTAKPLMDPVPAQPTNHQQHLLYAWRQKLVAALMHECVLIPEGVSDVAWLEALQTALELHQGWHDAGRGAPLLSTFIGIVPTIDAKIADTFALVGAVHARPCVLVDGDNEGRGYFDAVKTARPPPRCVVFWPQGWAMEHVVSWIAGADEAAMLAAVGAALGTPVADRQALTDRLLTHKSYAPTHESIAVTLMANAACRGRTAQLLNALCDVLRDPANTNAPLFARIPADSTATMHVFRFEPP
jgi:putative ATP-dependent endonuclease of the OLD family